MNYESTIVTPTDVLCGRTKDCFHHDGNHRFRVLIAEHAETYQMAPTKKLKMQVVLLVAEIVVARGGRFLVQTPEGKWVDGGIKQGKKKTGHAFRDALRGRVKCVAKLMRDNNDKLHQQQQEEQQLQQEEATSLSDDSSCSQSTQQFCEEFEEDLFVFDLVCDDIEPSKDWMHDKLDSSVANDLLMYFMMMDQ